jgi:HEAT repeat protein
MTPQEIDQLFSLTLTGDYEDERPWEAVSALRRIGTRDVMEHAAEWCRSGEPLKRARGAAILGQLGKTVEHRSNTFPEQSFMAITQLLQSETEAIPLSSAIAALGHLDDPRAVPLIVGHFQNPAQDVRFAVACSLGSFPNHPLAVQTLLTLTQDPDEDVRNWAVFGLGVLGDVDSAEIRDALFSRLIDPNEEVREEAIVGLAKRKDQRVIPALRDALTTHESGDSDVRMRISEAADYMLGIEEESRDWGAVQYLAALQERFSK